MAVTLTLAGCGGIGYTSSAADKTRGEKLFVSQCGQCHTLAAAGTNGVIGPNLDDAFRRAQADGMTDDTVRQVVRDQIQYPITNTSTGAPGMPGIDTTLPECGDNEQKGCVEDQGQAADDIATYVSTVAGRAVAKPGGTTPGGTDGKAIFTTVGCSSCHTLSDAGSSGTVGPNLDQAKPTHDLVVDRVTNGRGAMPPFKGRLTAAQIEAVAKYVSSVAGK